MRSDSSLSEEQRAQLVDLFEQGLGSSAAARLVGVSSGGADVVSPARTSWQAMSCAETDTQAATHNAKFINRTGSLDRFTVYS